MKSTVFVVIVNYDEDTKDRLIRGFPKRLEVYLISQRNDPRILLALVRESEAFSVFFLILIVFWLVFYSISVIWDNLITFRKASRVV